jgi:hypothetical protein
MRTHIPHAPVPSPIFVSCLVLALAIASGAGAFAADDPAPADGWVRLFSGKDLAGWKFRQQAGAEAWKIVSDVRLDPADPKKLAGSGEGGSDRGVLLRGAVDHGTDLLSEKDFGDCELHVEFNVPQRSNSGVYLMGRYEIQVLDSYGKADDRLRPGDCGGIYITSKPSKNATKPPGEWQAFDIVFQAPRFDASGKKTQNAKFLSVKLNGVEIQKEVEVKGPTGSEISREEKPTGPIMFQGDHGIVAFRNVRIKAKQP